MAGLAGGEGAHRAALTAVTAALALSGACLHEPAASQGQAAPTVVVPPGYFTNRPPPAGETFGDPAFGTTIRRLTDASGLASGGGIVPEYSQTSSFNLDDTFLVLTYSVDSQFELYRGDGSAVRILHEIPGVPAEPRWSRLDPSWLYFHTRATPWQIRRLDVATGEVEVVQEFGPDTTGITFGNGTGDVSDNERIVVLRNERYVSVWDLSDGVQVSAAELDTAEEPLGGAPIDWVTIAQDGGSYAIAFPGGAGRGRGVEQFDVDGKFMVQLMNTPNHSAMGRDIGGAPVLFVTNSASNPQQPPGCDNGIVKISLDGNATRTCLLVLDWSLWKHLSAHGGDGWVYVSTGQAEARPEPAPPGRRNDRTLWYPYTNEIFRVRADGSVVERLAHHRSSSKSYWIEPHASIGISGAKLVYGSDFHLDDMGEHYADTYLIEVPGAAAAPRPVASLPPAPR